MLTIADVQAVGYTTGLASGSVATEEEALTAARAAAAPETVAVQAAQVTQDTLGQLDAKGVLSVRSPAERLEIAQKIAVDAIEALTATANARVAFQERALEIARTMPDVWVVEQVAAGTVVVRAYVSAKDDGTGWDDGHQAIIDALADPAAYAERAWQAEHPDAMAAMAAIRTAGVPVERPTAGSDVFEAEQRTFTAAELPGFLTEILARPVPPTVPEKVAAALTHAPELGDATRAALLEALAQ